MKISDLMTTALVTGQPGDLVDESLFEMKLSSIRHLPVIDERGKLAGIVSDRDVLLSLGTSSEKTVRLRDIMSKRVITVTENDDAREAVRIMLREKIGCLPVLGDGGQLVGVVTQTDFLRTAQSLLSRPQAQPEGELWQELRGE